MEELRGLAAAAAIAAGCLLSAAQTIALPAAVSDAPPASGAIFPLSQVHAGLHATAWTVFRGTKPEPMDVEVLGVLRGGRGPGKDMILVQLHGAKPEYTGVVAGMSGSPVYVDSKLMGALAYRIGQFSRDPIAGITPIEQMLAVRDLPLTASAGSGNGSRPVEAGGMNLQPMETPLTMSGFGPEAIQFWQQQMKGTGLETVAAGGSGRSEGGGVAIPVLPGSAASAELIRGDVEMAATCTVTWMDAKQLLACGHPLFQLGTVSLPMTATEVVATLASPLNAFKIVNTGQLIGAFSEDRDAAIRGELGAQARMIPMRVTVRGGEQAKRELNVEVMDQPGLTPQASMVVLMEALTSALGNTAEASYHVRATVRLQGLEPVPMDYWATPTEAMPAPIAAAIQLGERITPLYTNGTRLTTLTGIEVEVDSLPRRAVTEITGARLVGSDEVHAGEVVELEATLRPWQQPERQVKMSFRLPARLGPGQVRVLISDAAMLDRALGRAPERAMEMPGQAGGHTADLTTVAAESRARHAADRLYVSLLEPEAQAAADGQTLSELPLSVANTLEPMRSTAAASLNGESAELVAEVPEGELVTGFAVLHLHIAHGAGLH